MTIFDLFLKELKSQRQTGLQISIIGTHISADTIGFRIDKWTYSLGLSEHSAGLNHQGSRKEQLWAKILFFKNIYL